MKACWPGIETVGFFKLDLCCRTGTENISNKEGFISDTASCTSTGLTQKPLKAMSVWTSVNFGLNVCYFRGDFFNRSASAFQSTQVYRAGGNSSTRDHLNWLPVMNLLTTDPPTASRSDGYHPGALNPLSNNHSAASRKTASVFVGY